MLSGRAVLTPKVLVDHCAKLDLAELPYPPPEHPPGEADPDLLLLEQPGSRFGLARFHTEGGDHFLEIVQLERDGEPELDRQELPLVPIYPYFGGERWWVRCEGLEGGWGWRPSCGRRVRTLFRPRGARFFACRECHRLTYRCRQQHRAWEWEEVLRPLRRHRAALADLRSRSFKRRGRGLLRLDPQTREWLLAELERGEVG